MNNIGTVNYADNIRSLEFYVLSDAEIKRTAACVVTNTTQFDKGQPTSSGLYDKLMGTISLNYNCASCNETIKHCPGHHGYYKLNYPLVYNVYKIYINKWINIICNRCHRIIMNPDLHKDGEKKYDIPTGTKNIILYIFNKKVKKIKTSKPNYCDYCNNIQEILDEPGNKLRTFFPTIIQPLYKENNKQERLLVLDEYAVFKQGGKEYSINKKAQEKNPYSVQLFPEDILKKLEQLPVSELEKFGLDARSHPKNFLFYNLCIPPSNLRHINKTKNEKYNNFMTAAIEEIINKDSNKAIEKSINYFNYELFEKKLAILKDISNVYNNYIAGSNEGNDDTTPISINTSIKGKNGIIRKNLLGKRPGGAFKSVIACDIKHDIGTIRISKKFAKNIIYKEVVTAYNIEVLQEYVNNKDNYPACTKIKIKAFGRSVLNNGTYKLQIGDIVYRNIINGEYLPICRYPSMKASNTTSMRTVIDNNKTVNNSMGMNVIICPYFNADFDGDMMYGNYNSDEAARFECDYLSAVKINFMNGEDLTPNLGQAQDTIIACGLLTMSTAKFTRWETQRLLNGIPININFTKKYYTGREIFSFVLPEFSYSVKSPFFSKDIIKNYCNYHQDDENIVIKNGLIESGIICGNFIKPSKKSLYHIIYNYFGVDVAIKTIRYHQIIANNFLFMNGITLDYGSYRINENTKKVMNIIQSEIYYKIDELNNKLMNNEIVSPSGITIRDYVDTLFKKCLDVGDKYLHALLLSLDPLKNWLMLMALTGSKGNLDGLKRTFCPVGLVTVDGKIIPNLLDYNRFSIWDHQFSLYPSAKGYVSESIIQGYKLSSVYAASRSTRNNIITKGLITADAGTEGRNMSKNSESFIIDNKRFLSKNNGIQVLQFNPGDDCADYKNLFPVKYKLAFTTEQEIKELYPTENNFVNKIIEDRNEYIRLELAKQNFNLKYIISDSLYSLVNMEQIMMIAQNSSKGDIKVLTNKVNEFCDNLHYYRFCDGRKLDNYPEFLKVIFTNLRILIRCEFTSKILKSINENTLDLILSKTLNTILDSFVVPGDAYGTNVSLTLTSPFTQYLIDAHHAGAAGGTSRDGLRDFKSTITIKPVAKSSNNLTYIFLKEKYEEVLENAIKLKNILNTQYLKDFIKENRVLFEEIGENATFPKDNEFVANYIKVNKKPKNLLNVLFRLVLDKSQMDSKFVKIENIISKFNNLFGDNIICVYGNNNNDIILHLYFVSGFDFSESGKSKNKSIIEKIYDFGIYLINDLIINEFEELINIKIENTFKYKLDKKGNLEKKKIYYLRASGINLKDTYLINVVDPVRSTCNNVNEIFKLCGYLETRNRIIDILNVTLESLGLAITNYIFVADLIMKLEIPSPLAPIGVNLREGDNILLHASFKDPIVALSLGALNCVENSVISSSSALIMGQVPQIGTLYNKVIYNNDYIEKISESVSIEDML